MKVTKANLNNLKHLEMYEVFCKENHIQMDFQELPSYKQSLYFFLEKDQSILENCKVEIIEDLRQASLQITEKEKSQGNHIFTLIKSCIEYLFTMEKVYDIFLQVHQKDMEKRLRELGYDVLSLGENEQGLLVYSILKEAIEEE